MPLYRAEDFSEPAKPVPPETVSPTETQEPPNDLPDLEPMSLPLPPEVPVETTPEPVPETSMATSDEELEVLRSAFESKVQEDTLLFLTALGKVRVLLEQYEGAVCSQARHRVMGNMLSAIGKNAPSFTPADLDELGLLITEATDGLIGVVSGPKVESVSPKVPVPLAEPPPVEDTQVELDPELVRHAENIQQNVYDIGLDVLKDMPLERKEPFLQALVAEVRALLAVIPQNHSLHWHVSKLIPILTWLKLESDTPRFILGLSKDSRSADWESIARDNWDRVKAYDTENKPRKSKPRPPSRKKDSSSDRPIPEWPDLRRHVGSASVTLIGGLVVNDKIKLIKDRFGFAAEWYEMTGDGSRQAQSLESKIMSGTFRVVLLLEGICNHKTADKIADACKASGTPWYYVDKAGTGYLERAFEALNQQLAS